MSLSKSYIYMALMILLSLTMTVQANDGLYVTEMASNPISLKISGSTTVHHAIIMPYEDIVKKATGYNLQIFPSSSGRGFLDMATGLSDIAMTSSDLNFIIEKANKNNTNNFINDDFHIHPIETMHIDFLVHPSNPIDHISPADIVKIMSGDINHWSYFGHNNLGEIRVVTEHETGGMYTLIEKKLLNGKAITDNAIMLQNSPQIITVMAQLPNSFGFLSNGFRDTHSEKLGHKSLKKISDDVAGLEQNLAFIVKKNDPDLPYIQTVIEQFIAVHKANKYGDHTYNERGE